MSQHKHNWQLRAAEAAFPWQPWSREEDTLEPGLMEWGLSIREYLAAQFLAALIQSGSYTVLDDPHGGRAQRYCFAAVGLADQLLVELERPEQIQPAEITPDFLDEPPFDPDPSVNKDVAGDVGGHS